MRFLILLSALLFSGGHTYAQVVEDQVLYVCTKPCMIYMTGAPRPVLESKYGQTIRGLIDQSRRYLVWTAKQGSYYADIRNFMLKSDLDAVHESVLRLQAELKTTKQNAVDAKMQAAETAPKTISGTLTDDYGYKYDYKETITSEGYSAAKAQAAALSKSTVAMQTELSALKKRWSGLLSAAGYSVVW